MGFCFFPVLPSISRNAEILSHANKTRSSAVDRGEEDAAESCWRSRDWPTTVLQFTAMAIRRSRKMTAKQCICIKIYFAVWYRNRQQTKCNIILSLYVRILCSIAVTFSPLYVFVKMFSASQTERRIDVCGMKNRNWWKLIIPLCFLLTDVSK